MGLSRFIGVSDHWLARFGRGVYRAITGFSLPAPRALTRPVLRIFTVARSIYHFLIRVVICEPLFKAYCTRYGHHVKTGVFVHWVMGDGDIVLGNDVVLDGKSSFHFAVRYSENPKFSIGNHCYVGHGCAFTIGKEITIGNDCYIAGGVRMLDSSGHPTDPTARRAGLPTPQDKVRPIVIGDNVWIGAYATICPGVVIGDGSVVGTGSVVTKSVPPYTVVAGNPARHIRNLTMEAESSTRKENALRDQRVCL